MAKQNVAGEKLILIIKFVSDFIEDTILDGVFQPRMTENNLDFEKLTIINSSGITTWIKWIASRSKTTKITIENYSRFVVNSANKFFGFFSLNYRVKSLFVPCYCNDCSISFSNFIETADPRFMDKIPESTECPKCHNQVELDAVKKNYFKFLQR